MSDLQATADRVEIEAMRGEFTDAVMMCDQDLYASLFSPDGVPGPLPTLTTSKARIRRVGAPSIGGPMPLT